MATASSMRAHVSGDIVARVFALDKAHNHNSTASPIFVSGKLPKFPAVRVFALPGMPVITDSRTIGWVNQNKTSRHFPAGTPATDQVAFKLIEG